MVYNETYTNCQPISKGRKSSILSKNEAVIFDLYVSNGVYVYLIWSAFVYDVINMKSQNHNVKVYDVIDNMMSQSI